MKSVFVPSFITVLSCKTKLIISLINSLLIQGCRVYFILNDKQPCIVTDVIDLDFFFNW